MCFVISKLIVFFKGFRRCFTGQLRPKPCKRKKLVLFYLPRDKFQRGMCFLNATWVMFVFFFYQPLNEFKWVTRACGEKNTVTSLCHSSGAVCHHDVAEHVGAAHRAPLPETRRQVQERRLTDGEEPHPIRLNGCYVNLQFISASPCSVLLTRYLCSSGHRQDSKNPHKLRVATVSFFLNFTRESVLFFLSKKCFFTSATFPHTRFKHSSN